MQNHEEKLPNCPCGNYGMNNQLVKAKYYCLKGCDGPKYYCEEFCLVPEKHNHLPKRIVELVFEYEMRWGYLKQDIQIVDTGAKKSFIPYDQIAENLETLFEDRVSKGLKQEYCDLQNLKEQINVVYSEGTESTEGVSIQEMITKFKLIELIDSDRHRTQIGEDLDKLRSLAIIDEEKFYNLYKDAIAIASTKGRVWEGLDDKSKELLTNLKMRELEESKFLQARQL